MQVKTEQSINKITAVLLSVLIVHFALL